MAAVPDDNKYDRFDARAYLFRRYPAEMFQDRDCGSKYGAPWSLQWYHHFYQQYNKYWDHSTARMLDLGGGPCIYSHISAALHVSEIYHSDFVESCRNEVLMWKCKDPNAYDWSPFVEHVVRTLECQEGPDIVARREDIIRSKLKEVLYCDVSTPRILSDSASNMKFDIIQSNYCIENVIKSKEEFETILRNVQKLLSSNGFLVLLVNLECSFYINYGQRYQVCPLSEGDISSTLEKIGFTVCHKMFALKSLQERKSSDQCDTKGRACFIARQCV